MKQTQNNNNSEIDVNDEEIDEDFEHIWNNLSSRRICESVHRIHNIREFDIKNKKPEKQKIN